MDKLTERLCVDGIAIEFNPMGGNILDFAIDVKGDKPLRPLHVAPWVDDGDSLPASIPLVERQLAGDFFCAPFGGVHGSPIHGWTANGHWQSSGVSDHPAGGRTAHYVLKENVCGATVSKELTLLRGHPILYQRHRFAGGNGHLPVAHHAMIHVPGGARLSFSPRQYGVTPNTGLETKPDEGRSILAYPQRFTSLYDIQSADGTPADVSFFPFAQGHEDIVVLAAVDDVPLGWSAALANKDGFLFFAIKDATLLPETLLWMSNGGRHYLPWSSRHTNVLGIEEAATSCHQNHEFSSGSGRSAAGLVMGMTLAETQTTSIPYCFGAIPAPAGWQKVSDIRIGGDSLTLQDVSGDEVSLPFAGEHFGLQ